MAINGSPLQDLQQNKTVKMENKEYDISFKCDHLQNEVFKVSFPNEAYAHALKKKKKKKLLYCIKLLYPHHVTMSVYLLLLKNMVKPCFSSNLFDKLLGESCKWEHGLSQGILGDLTEEEGLVF